LERKLPNGAAVILQSPSSSGEKVTDSAGRKLRRGERGILLLLGTIHSAVFKCSLHLRISIMYILAHIKLT
jgi:hypothetical protein